MAEYLEAMPAVAVKVLTLAQSAVCGGLCAVRGKLFVDQHGRHGVTWLSESRIGQTAPAFGPAFSRAGLCILYGHGRLRPFPGPALRACRSAVCRPGHAVVCARCCGAPSVSSGGLEDRAGARSGRGRAKRGRRPGRRAGPVLGDGDRVRNEPVVGAGLRGVWWVVPAVGLACDSPSPERARNEPCRAGAGFASCVRLVVLPASLASWCCVVQWSWAWRRCRHSVRGVKVVVSRGCRGGFAP